MRKTFGFALSLLLALTAPAAAEMVKGTVKEVQKSGVVVLADGTQIWVSANYVNDLMAGDLITAVYQKQGDKNVATEIDRRIKMSDGTETTNFGAR